MGLDTSIVLWLSSLVQSSAGYIVVKLCGMYLPYLLLLVLIVLILREPSRRKKFYYTGLALLSLIFSRGVLTELIRQVYDRSRPFEVLDVPALLGESMSGAFPSGHAVVVFCLFLIVLLMKKSKWSWIVGIGVVVVGIARIAGGLHWPSDILGGFALATIVFLILYYWILPSRISEPGQDEQ